MGNDGKGGKEWKCIRTLKKGRKSSVSGNVPNVCTVTTVMFYSH